MSQAHYGLQLPPAEGISHDMHSYGQALMHAPKVSSTSEHGHALTLLRLIKLSSRLKRGAFRSGAGGSGSLLRIASGRITARHSASKQQPSTPALTSQSSSHQSLVSCHILVCWE